jgi:hypothetical protein
VTADGEIYDGVAPVEGGLCGVGWFCRWVEGIWGMGEHGLGGFGGLAVVRSVGGRACFGGWAESLGAGVDHGWGNLRWCCSGGRWFCRWVEGIWGIGKGTLMNADGR